MRTSRASDQFALDILQVLQTSRPALCGLQFAVHTRLCRVLWARISCADIGQNGPSRGKEARRVSLAAGRASCNLNKLPGGAAANCAREFHCRAQLHTFPPWLELQLGQQDARFRPRLVFAGRNWPRGGRMHSLAWTHRRALVVIIKLSALLFGSLCPAKPLSAGDALVG